MLNGLGKHLNRFLGGFFGKKYVLISCLSDISMILWFEHFHIDVTTWFLDGLMYGFSKWALCSMAVSLVDLL